MHKTWFKLYLDWTNTDHTIQYNTKYLLQSYNRNPKFKERKICMAEFNSILINMIITLYEHSVTESVIDWTSEWRKKKRTNEQDFHDFLFVLIWKCYWLFSFQPKKINMKHILLEKKTKIRRHRHQHMKMFDVQLD